MKRVYRWSFRTFHWFFRVFKGGKVQISSCWPGGGPVQIFKNQKILSKIFIFDFFKKRTSDLDSAHQNWLESIPISFFYDFLKISKKISKIKKPPWNFYFWFFSKTDFRFGFSASNLTTIDTHLNFFDFLKILKKSKKGGPKMKKKFFSMQINFDSLFLPTLKISARSDYYF